MTTLSFILLLAPICEKITFVGAMLAFIFAAIGLAYIVYMCGGFTYDGEPKNTSKKWPVLCFILAVVFSLIAALMPDRRTVYMVAGVETINKFSQTEVAKELGENGMSIVKDITTMIHTYTMDAVKESQKKNEKTNREN
jgi:RsiW-degrading membrane proteinase PrsW (M82 family)